MQENKNYLAEVWGDTVVLKELLLASLIGIILTMAGYLIGRSVFSNLSGLDEGLVKGYSLMVGILGCVLSGVISAILFKPKRIVEEQYEGGDIEDILKFGGVTLEEEIEALQSVDPQILAEMRSLQLSGLLQLKDKKQ